MSQTALIGLEAGGIQPWDELGRAMKLAGEIGKVLAVSSVVRAPAVDDRPEVLRAVVKILTAQDPHAILIQIKTSCPPWDDISSFRLLLLRYAELFEMTPEMTLPHPALIGEPRWLITAAEVDPDWSHPVRSMTLAELARPLRFSPVYDFYAQGQTLLAFLEPKT